MNSPSMDLMPRGHSPLGSFQVFSVYHPALHQYPTSVRHREDHCIIIIIFFYIQYSQLVTFTHQIKKYLFKIIQFHFHFSFRILLIFPKHPCLTIITYLTYFLCHCQRQILFWPPLYKIFRKYPNLFDRFFL